MTVPSLRDFNVWAHVRWALKYEVQLLFRMCELWMWRPDKNYTRPSLDSAMSENPRFVALCRPHHSQALINGMQQTTRGQLSALRVRLLSSAVWLRLTEECSLALAVAGRCQPLFDHAFHIILRQAFLKTPWVRLTAALSRDVCSSRGNLMGRQWSSTEAMDSKLRETFEYVGLAGSETLQLLVRLFRWCLSTLSAR